MIRRQPAAATAKVLDVIPASAINGDQPERGVILTATCPSDNRPTRWHVTDGLAQILAPTLMARGLRVSCESFRNKALMAAS